MTLENKNIIITGASSGIGKALAFELAKKNVNLVLLARNINALNEIKNQLSSAFSKIAVMKCDVSEPEDIRNAVKFAEECFGQIDGALLNAGIEENTYFSDFENAVLEKVFSVNVFGITRFFTELVPLMRERGGFIAGVTSLADGRSFPGSSAYCSSKIATSYLLESARAELSGTKIKVITIKPGFVRTPMTDEHPYYMPFLIDADKAAKIIIKGIEKGKSRIYFPIKTAFLMYLVSIMPDTLWDLFGARFAKKFKKAQ